VDDKARQQEGPGWLPALSDGAAAGRGHGWSPPGEASRLSCAPTGRRAPSLAHPAGRRAPRVELGKKGEAAGERGGQPARSEAGRVAGRLDRGGRRRGWGGAMGDEGRRKKR